MLVAARRMGLGRWLSRAYWRLDACLCLILLVLFPAFSWLQGQDVNYDARNYHLYASLTFLANDYAADLLPGGTQTFLNPLASLPAAGLYYASQLFGPLLPTLLFSLLQGLALVLVYAIGLRLFAGDRPLAFLAALLGGTAPIVLSEAGNTMADLSLSLLSTGSVALLLMALDGRPGTNPRPWLLVISAGLAGAAVGMKLTFIFLLPLLLLLLLGLLFPAGRPPNLRLILQSVLCTVLPFLLSLIIFLSPQLINSSLNTGSPLFPLFNRHFRSPLHEDVNPSESRFLPESFGDLLLAPLFEFTDSFYGPFNPDMDLKTRRSEVLIRDVRPLLWALSSMVLLLLQLWRRQVKSLQLGLVLGLIASSLFCVSISGIARYAIPLQLLQGLVIALACQELLACSTWRWSRRAPALLMGVLLTLSLVSQITPSWGRSSFDHHWSMILKASTPAVVPLRDGHLRFPVGVPLVLLERPIGWIKAHTLPSHNPLLNWDPGISPRTTSHSKLPQVHERIESQLLSSGFDRFLVLTLSTDPSVVAKRLEAFLAEAPQLESVGFRVSGCSTYQASMGLHDFSLCIVSQNPRQ